MTTPTPTDLPEALRIISEWPITDPGNMDAANMAAVARAALSAAAPAVAHDEVNQGIKEFSEGQWWIEELDAAVSNRFLGDSVEVTPDLKRAVAVVHNLLRQIADLSAASTTEQSSEVAQASSLVSLLEETLRPGAYGVGSTLAMRIEAALKTKHEAAKIYGWDCAGALVRTRNTMESYLADGVEPIPLYAAPPQAGAESYPPSDAVTADGDPSNVELRGMWYGAGGTFHGPRVETGTMPEAKLLPFLRSLIATAALRARGAVPSRAQIRDVFLANGFTVKEGQTDLKEYVYDAAYALLALAPAAPMSVQVPSGWKLVPVEPTFEMAAACLSIVDLEQGDPEDHRYDDGRGTAASIYRAMLAAAPQPPAALPGEQDEADGKLWCVHVHGPDDVHAMPTRAAALERANEFNEVFGRHNFKEGDPIMRAVVIEWPHSAESHAAELRLQTEAAKGRAEGGAA